MPIDQMGKNNNEKAEKSHASMAIGITLPNNNASVTLML